MSSKIFRPNNITRKELAKDHGDASREPNSSEHLTQQLLLEILARLPDAHRGEPREASRPKLYAYYLLSFLLYSPSTPWLEQLGDGRSRLHLSKTAIRFNYTRKSLFNNLRQLREMSLIEYSEDTIPSGTVEIRVRRPTAWGVENEQDKPSDQQYFSPSQDTQGSRK